MPKTSDKRSAQTRSAAARANACTASELFGALWVTLVDVLGPTATATLLQRSIKRAEQKRSDLEGLTISHEHFTYTYSVPRSWARAGEEPIAALRQVIEELWPLLSELTGTVVLRRLRGIPNLERCGVIPKDAEL